MGECHIWVLTKLKKWNIPKVVVLRLDERGIDIVSIMPDTCEVVTLWGSLECSVIQLLPHEEEEA